jgi:hypothetical protein
MPRMPKPLPPKPEPGNKPGVIHTPVSAETDVKIKAIYAQLVEQINKLIFTIKVDGGEIAE